MKGRAWIPVAVLAGVALLGVTVFLALGTRGRDPREVASGDPDAKRESEGDRPELVDPQRASPGRIAREADAQREPELVEAGLLSAGEAVDEPVASAAPRPLLEFRVLEAPGLPMADTPLEMRLRMGELEKRFVARTGAEGGFRLELVSGYASSDRVLWVFAREQTLGLRVDLGRTLGPGLTSMGDLLLAPTPVLIAGRVFENGGAVEGAVIEVERCTLDASGELLYWEKLGREIRSGTQGRFEARDLLESERLRVRARSENRLSRASVVRPGTDTLELALLRTGTLAGSLRLAPTVEAAEVRVRLVPEEIEEPEWAWDAKWSFHGQVRGDGSFELEELLPGRHVFSLWGGALARPVEVSGIVILPGAARRDARLQGLDLLDLPEATPAEGR